MKEIIRTDQAPAAIGPYSQAVKIDCGTLVFCSMQIALDPETGEITGTSAQDQCRRVMKNLDAVLRTAGADFSKVVKTTIYLADIDDFGPVNEVYSTHFGSDPPARAAVEVSRLPRDARVAIEAFAIV